MIKKGDPVMVRLSTGELVKATYERASCIPRHHLVKTNDINWELIGRRDGSRFVLNKLNSQKATK